MLTTRALSLLGRVFPQLSCPIPVSLSQTRIPVLVALFLGLCFLIAALLDERTAKEDPLILES